MYKIRACEILFSFVDSYSELNLKSMASFFVEISIYNCRKNAYVYFLKFKC